MIRRPIRSAAVVAATLAVLSAAPASAVDTATSVRVAGESRYGTAATIAISAFESVNGVVLATGEGFADALAANYLAGAVGSPILLTPTDRMFELLPDVLEELESTGVIMVGGTSAIASSVGDELAAEGYESSRVAGEDRFKTARAIVDLLPSEAIGEFQDKGRTAILVNGFAFADALTAGPMSYAQGWPILLTGADRLHAEAGGAIQEHGITHVIIVGGDGVVSDAVVNDLTTLGVTSERLAGETRQGTALAVANFEYGVLGFGGDDMVLARGDDYPDALAAGPRAGDEIMPIILTNSPTALGKDGSDFIKGHAHELNRIEVFGGTAAISQAVEDEALRYAKGFEE